MATSTTHGLSIPVPSAVVPAARAQVSRRRRIPPQTGRALEILGHAIEYLTDEFIHQGRGVCSQDEQLQAVQLLMALNRQIYFECPEVPTLGERLRSMLGIHAA